MLVKDFRGLALVLGPLVLLSILTISLWQTNSEFLLDQYNQFRGRRPSQSQKDEEEQNNLGSVERKQPLPPPSAWHEIFSVSTPNRTFFEIKFGTVPVFNPNILPHPTEPEAWIIMGQKWVSHEDFAVGLVAYEMACTAKFFDYQLRCTQEPEALAIEPTPGKNCEGKWEILNLNVGPHDARAFYGPEKPYTIYGSNSNLVCFGQWIQDFRRLLPSVWKSSSSPSSVIASDLKEDKTFVRGTEIHRPPPSHPIEKNYFIFWDKHNDMYAHYDVFPQRSFARLGSDGTVGPNLAARSRSPSAKLDEKCLARYLPAAAGQFESIHQATNSLKITLCNRNDSRCLERPDRRTFIMTIIQHKSYYNFHSEYEPYLVLFRDAEPFGVYGVSEKPLWISGRGRDEEGKRTDMLYVTSISWKEQGAKYEGYLDDVVFLGFGWEDKRAGGLDVRVEDLIEGIGFCEGGD